MRLGRIEIMILVGLGVAIIVSLRLQPTPSNGNHVLHFNPTDVNQLVIRDQTGAAIQIARQHGRWFVQNSGHNLADPKQVTAAIDALATISSSTPISGDSQTYGLSPASFDVVVEHDTTRLAELYIGQNHGATGCVYVQSAMTPTIYCAPATELQAIEAWLHNPPQLANIQAPEPSH